ncbi:hypothetical protein BHS09_04805 [Myxococcus xanthus]|uniref:H repeat-associated protein N-terminal domain-containing protein n=1 Tax=Myxococcus xanthus TaxID=34 RepID=A0AAE6FW01_MYXXA|nr:hypothetical protein BHS09_04805 [Myxococcus xanthus]QDE73646.1 hypothetical protein BHS08_04810 [Myxococcus xanthus]
MSLLLFARFSAVEDSRRHAQKVVFPLELLLLIVFGAAVRDMPGWQGAADLARLKEAWLRKLCPWDSSGRPSADTLERDIGRLDAELFAEGFSVWMRDVAARRALPSSGVQQVAVDGKSLRGGEHVRRARRACRCTLFTPIWSRVATASWWGWCPRQVVPRVRQWSPRTC